MSVWASGELSYSESVTGNTNNHGWRSDNILCGWKCNIDKFFSKW